MMDHLEAAKYVVRVLVEAGHIAYFAGGWVRDYIMKKPSDDIDIATSANVSQIEALFPRTIPVGVTFGIVIVVIDSHQFEVATFRKDRDYVDGRRPTGIDKASPEEDAQRRDFTINGLFFDPLKGKVYDYVSGIQDIEQGLVRAIGDAKARFTEDRLRMMRAVRYSTRFGFPIEPHTMAAIFELAHTLLPSVAMERIWQEFKKMSQFEHFDTGLVMLHDLGLLPTIFPELKACSSYEIRDRVKFIPAFPKHVPTIAELLELFPDASLEQAFLLCEKLKLSRHEKEFVDFYIKSKKLLNFPVDWKTRLEPIEWAYFYASPFSNTVLNIEACRLPENEKNNFIQAQIEHRAQLEPAIQRIICKNPVVKAEHLMAAGVLPGKKMGLLLKEAEKIAINQKMEDPQAIINILKKLLIW